ncbi:hypothetical protein B0I35DRAFT_491718 [Stachybotrys elegans]|uniref:Uncharacterized protein n=1 Tax=Stachybotrys elegans TaxID=80388 RepID=A0A8K0SHU4_9HYPO|nr:hypothetical protein B0I35DRAFT_491718 [Stachybotrys elegans]
MPRLEPVAKLPLAVRKNVRDEWESKKEELEKSLSDLLGETWTLEADPASLYPYGEEGSYGKTSTGSLIYDYFESGIRQIKYFIERNGDDVKAEINSICSAHVIKIDYDDEKRFTYNGCIVSDGALVMLFEDNYLATNINDVLSTDKFEKALNDAPSPSGAPMSFIVRNTIKQDYDAKIGEVQDKINKLLDKEIALEPQFEENFAALKAAKDKPDHWEPNVGNFIYLYFDALAYALNYQKFGEDELLREGFHEGVESAKVVFRVVDKSKMKASYNESVIEDGVLYLQTSPDNFGTNVSQIAEKVVDLL